MCWIWRTLKRRPTTYGWPNPNTGFRWWVAINAHIGIGWPIVSGPTLAQQCTTEKISSWSFWYQANLTILLITAISKLYIHSEYFTKRSLTKWQFLLTQFEKNITNSVMFYWNTRFIYLSSEWSIPNFLNEICVYHLL